MALEEITSDYRLCAGDSPCVQIFARRSFIIELLFLLTKGYGGVYIFGGGRRAAPTCSFRHSACTFPTRNKYVEYGTLFTFISA